MKSPGWLWHDQLQNMGCSPDDIEPEHGEPPTSIIVEYFAPYRWFDEDMGVMTEDQVPWGREFPFFMSKAAERYAEYCRRKYGAKNVRVEYE